MKKISIKTKDKELKRMRRRHRLLNKGLSEKQIEEMEKNENVRTVLCLVYGSYSVEDGTKKIKKDKKEVEVPNVIYGPKALEISLNKDFDGKFNLLYKGGNAIYINTTAESVEAISELMKKAGRIQVWKWVESEKKEKKEKKHTNNTPSTRRAAKNKRKKKNSTKAKMRAFYAAKRNGGKISRRIIIHNPTLAKKIEAWLKKQDDVRELKKKSSNHHQKRGTRKKVSLPTLEQKRMEHAKKVGKAIITKEEKLKAEKLKMAKNAKKKAAEIAKKAAKKEQSLKFAA